VNGKGDSALVVKEIDAPVSGYNPVLSTLTSQFCIPED